MIPLINRARYQTLLDIRSAMNEKGLTDLASVFVPVGTVAPPDQSFRVLFIGRATRGYDNVKLEYESARDVGEQVVQRHLPKGTWPFWHFARAVLRQATRVLGVLDSRAPDDALPQYAGWSNLAKIGVIDGNPTGNILRHQAPVCVQALRDEIRMMKPTAVVVSTGFFAHKEIFIPVFGDLEAGWFQDVPDWDRVAFRRVPALDTTVIWTDHPHTLRLNGVASEAAISTASVIVASADRAPWSR
jgi:hypothetical protein